MRSHRRLSNGQYLDINYSSDDKVVIADALLAHYKYEPESTLRIETTKA